MKVLERLKEETDEERDLMKQIAKDNKREQKLWDDKYLLS